VGRSQKCKKRSELSGVVPVHLPRARRPPRQGQTLNSLGQTYATQGRWPEAKACFDQSLPIRRELGDRLGEAYILRNLDEWHKDQGQFDEAIAHYQEALCTRRELEAWPQVEETLHALAEVYTLRGDWAKAAEMAEQAAEAWRSGADERILIVRRGDMGPQAKEEKNGAACY